MNGGRILEILDRGTLLGQVFTPVREDTTLFLQNALSFAEGVPKRSGPRIHVRTLNGSIKLLADTRVLFLLSRRRNGCRHFIRGGAADARTHRCDNVKVSLSSRHACVCVRRSGDRYCIQWG